MKNKKNIVYIVTQADYGGVQSHIAELMKAFRKKYDILLVVGNTGYLTEVASDLEIPYCVVSGLKRSLNPIDIFVSLIQFCWAIKGKHVHLIHAHSMNAGLTGRLSSVFYGIPSLFSSHGWIFTSGKLSLTQRLLLFNEKLMAKLSANIICVSEYDRELALMHGIGRADQLITIHNGITDKKFSVTHRSSPVPRLIMVARFDVPKDHFTLIKAISKIRHLHFKMILVGSGSLLESSKLLVDDLNLKDQVEFLGDRNDVDHLLEESDMFILSTWREGLPISILEAMQFGLPVIASNVHGIPEEVIDNETGLLFEAGDIDDLANKISHLLDHPDIRFLMGEQARKRYLEHFTTDIMLEKIDVIYYKNIK